MTVLHIYEKIIMNVSFQGADMSLTHSTMYIVTSRDFMHNECKWPSPVFGLSVQCVCVCVCACMCVWWEGLFPRVFVAEFQSVCGL